MSILDWLNKKQSSLKKKQKLDLPGDLWVKCHQCNKLLYLKALEENHNVCDSCQYHFRISPKERVRLIFDPNTFQETDKGIYSIDFLKFEDTQQYTKRLEKAKKKSNNADAMVIGMAKLENQAVNIGVMDFSFMGGSMGSVVGEKIARLIEAALENKHPLIIFTSSGGARMQEGIMSLMQMAKTSAALHKLGEESVPYISVLCDPTTGGTSASFAMLGDINIGEPGALISFAGPRVIEQTLREKLPKGFQRSEFLLKHGMLDLVVDRRDMRHKLAHLVRVLNPEKATKESSR